MMAIRRVILFTASLVLSVFLVAVLARMGTVDSRVLLQHLKSISWTSFAKLAALNSILVLVSTEKWRYIDDVMRSSSDTAPSWLKCYFLTSLGLALGIVLPTQFAMSTARSLGIYVDGRAIQRGTLGTLYEQGFDVLVVIFLTGATTVTWLLKGGAFTWSVAALSMAVLAIASAAPLMKLAHYIGVRLAKIVGRKRLSQTASSLVNSRLFNPRLASRLMLLSVVRWFVVVLMSTQTAEAMNLHIPLWQIGAAITLVVLTSIAALTPGGIGVNELTSVTVLRVFGTPLRIGAQWALGNRILVICSYFFVAACAAVVLLFQRIVPRWRMRSNAPTTSIELERAKSCISVR